MKKILVFEPKLNGHPFAYIACLCEYLNTSKIANVVFVLNNRFNAKYNYVIKKYAKSGFIDFICLNGNEQRACEHQSLIMRGFNKYKIAMTYAKRLSADHCHFLHIDHLQFALGICRSTFNSVKVSGILFLPSVHYHLISPTTVHFMQRIKSIRKRISYSLMFANPNVKVVFSLDPYFVHYAVGKLPCSSKLHFLPDPCIFSMCSANSEESKFIDALDMTRSIFLLFGFLEKRKGILQVLDSLQYLTPRVRKLTQIVFAGVIDPALREEFIGKLRSNQNRFPEVNLLFEERFIEDSEILKALEKCACVLAPYQEFVGSSGVILWAAGAGKPVITQDYGMVGKMVRELELGMTVNSKDPRIIARAISSFIESPMASRCNKAKMAELARRHDPMAFGKRILDAICTPELYVTGR